MFIISELRISGYFDG